MTFARLAFLTGISAAPFFMLGTLNVPAAEGDRVDARFEIYDGEGSAKQRVLEERYFLSGDRRDRS